jgi:DNA-binding SARP family transcriptional activator
MLSGQSGTLSRLDDGSWPPVLLCLLGGFQLFRNGQPVGVRSHGKSEALLALLGLATRGVPREQLLDSLWPDSEPGLSGQALNSLVHSLRGLLGGALGGASPIVRTAGRYHLNEAAGVATDVARFDSLVRRGEQHERAGNSGLASETYARAVGVYRGDLASAGEPGVHAIMERERLRSAYLTLLVRLADHAFDQAEFGACLSYALQLLAHDPCREDAHRLVMRCHVRRGERAQALRHYSTVRAIMRTEFQTEPEAATLALFERVRLDPGSI